MLNFTILLECKISCKQIETYVIITPVVYEYGGPLSIMKENIISLEEARTPVWKEGILK